MPLYDFKCHACHVISESVTRHDEPAPKCGCGGETKRLFPSRTTFVWGQGGGLADVHDKEFARMEAAGELP